MPKLRGHHLICLHFFKGEGYDEGFVNNLGAVLETTEVSPVMIASGNDDVCGSCLHGKNDECRYSEHSDNEIREMDDRALKLLETTQGAEVVWREIREKIPAIFRAWHESYCIACGWRRACEKTELYRALASSTNKDIEME